MFGFTKCSDLYRERYVHTHGNPGERCNLSRWHLGNRYLHGESFCKHHASDHNDASHVRPWIGDTGPDSTWG